MDTKIKIPVIFASQGEANAWAQPIIHNDGSQTRPGSIPLQKSAGRTEPPDQPAPSRMDPARSR